MHKLNKYIEHTLLKSDASAKEIEKLALDALKYDFFGVCININYINYIKQFLSGSDVKIVTVVNFPLDLFRLIQWERYFIHQFCNDLFRFIHS